VDKLGEGVCGVVFNGCGSKQC